MDQQTYQLIQTGIYAGAATLTLVGGVIAIARYSFLKRKSANENAGEIGKAEAEKTRALSELEQGRLERTKELLADTNYQDLLKRRGYYAEEQIKVFHQRSLFGNFPTHLCRTLDDIFGELSH